MSHWQIVAVNEAGDERPNGHIEMRLQGGGGLGRFTVYNARNEALYTVDVPLRDTSPRSFFGGVTIGLSHVFPRERCVIEVQGERGLLTMTIEPTDLMPIV
jgi:hypothetical protein